MESDFQALSIREKEEEELGDQSLSLFENSLILVRGKWCVLGWKLSVRRFDRRRNNVHCHGGGRVNCFRGLIEWLLLRVLRVLISRKGRPLEWIRDMRSILSNFSSKVGIGVANKENIVGDDLGDNSVGPVDELDVNIKHTEASVIKTDDLKKRPRSTVDDTVDGKPF
ncbi:hypothetical protein Golob_021547, partial [Gossypium lobatum]|nr:hypothetical protein [Gossypium lobatum]